MKKHLFTFPLAASVILALSGCDRSQPAAEAEPPLISLNVNTQRWQPALTAAELSVKTAAGQVAGWVTNVDFAGVAVQLQALATNVNLTAGQKQALRQKLAAAQSALAEALVTAKTATGQAAAEARVFAEKVAEEARATAERAAAEARSAAEKAEADARRIGRDLSGEPDRAPGAAGQ